MVSQPHRSKLSGMDRVTRVVLVHSGGFTEKWAASWEAHLQDDGRTLKLFPKEETEPQYEHTPGFFGGKASNEALYPDHEYTGTPGIIGGNCRVCGGPITEPWHRMDVKRIAQEVESERRASALACPHNVPNFGPDCPVCDLDERGRFSPD